MHTAFYAQICVSRCPLSSQPEPLHAGARRDGSLAACRGSLQGGPLARGQLAFRAATWRAQGWLFRQLFSTLLLLLVLDA